MVCMSGPGWVGWRTRTEAEGDGRREGWHRLGSISAPVEKREQIQYYKRRMTVSALPSNSSCQTEAEEFQMREPKSKSVLFIIWEKQLPNNELFYL